MAKDDFFVIVYQVLKYLYEGLKTGEEPEAIRLTASAYSIPESYWGYILLSLLEEGYVKGIAVHSTKSGILFSDLQDAVITPKGIEYLFENSLLQKVKRTLKDVKELIPFQ